MMREIHETHNINIIEDFNAKCEQKLNGGKVQLDNDVEIHGVTKSDDLVVNVGLQHCINIALGTLSTRWQYMAWDVGTDPGTTPAVTDTLLQTHTVSLPYNPIDMSGIQGWREAAGMKLYFGAIRAQTEPGGGTFTNLGEIGVVQTNASSGIILLNRSKFVKNRVVNTTTPDLAMNAAVNIISVVVEFCPVT